jgi:peroxiredoxin Q/BCP
VTLDFRGVTVLYFYPKDDTPGCTAEACSFRDDLKEFERRGVKVYGVSTDDAASHKKFAQKFGLNFPLLADPGEEDLSRLRCLKLSGVCAARDVHHQRRGDQESLS